MSTKNKVLIVVVYTVVIAAAARYTTPVKIVTEIKTVEVEKKTEDKKQDVAKNTRKKTKTVENIKPTGEKVVTTITTEETVSEKKTDVTSTDDKAIVTDDKKQQTNDSGKITLSLLGGAKLVGSGTDPIVYGLSVNKNLIGPVNFGLWGLNNGTCGVSVGLQF